MSKLFQTLIIRYRFVWDSGLLVVMGAATGLLYMVTQSVLGRMMGEVDYAQVVALLGLLNVLSLPASAMQLTMARYVAEHAQQNAVQIWVTIFKRALRRVGLFSLSGFLLWGLFSGVLQEFFNAPSILSIIILGLMALTRLFSPIISGALQGGSSFGWLASLGVSDALFRLLFCVTAFFVGARTDGVLGAIAIATLFSLSLGCIPFRRVVAQTPAIEGYDTRPIYRYLWPVLLGQGAMLLLMNGDVMFSAKFLDGKELAVYGKAATLSRMILFLAQPVAIAMFPRAVNSSNRILFFGPFLFALLTSVAAALVISLFPIFPMKLMYGVSDPVYLQTAGLYVWAALPLSLSGIATKYLWARHRTGRALLLLPVVAVYFLLLFLFHETPKQMIGCLAIGGWSSVAVLIGSVFTGSRSRA
jgi:O-antigen/teichoic acid export membrane protein